MFEAVEAQLSLTEFAGQTIWVNQHDAFVSKKILEQGVWEAYETELFLKLLKTDSIVLDIGANLGYYSFLAAQKMTQGVVYAFEPEPDNFSLLSKNTESFSNVKRFNCALGEHNGQLLLHKSLENPGDHQSYDRGDQRETIEVEVRRGDQLLADLPRIDLIKIDVQGAEFTVFNGLKELIQRSLPSVSIICEFYPKGLQYSGYSAHQLLDLLLSYGLQLKVIDHIKHKLWDFPERDLRSWIDEVDNNLENEGFMNLLLLPATIAPNF